MLTKGTIIGRTHRLMHQNCQDAAFAEQPTPDIAFGLVVDGCGSKYREKERVYPSRNEIGARLLGHYAAAFLTRHLAVRSVQIADLITQLYQACLTYLDCHLTLIPFPNEQARQRYIATHLLSTLVGFVLTPDTAVCFWSGDGYLAVNNQIIYLESNNQPNYLAYQLMSKRQNGRFCMLTIRQRPTLTRLIAATDGWREAQLQQLPAAATSLALQRWINISARQRGHFEDDGAVVVYQKETT